MDRISIGYDLLWNTLKFIDNHPLKYLIWYFCGVCCVIIHMQVAAKGCCEALLLWNSKGKAKGSKMLLGSQDLLLYPPIPAAPSDPGDLGLIGLPSWAESVPVLRTYAFLKVKKCQYQPKLQRYLVGRRTGIALLHTGRLGLCRTSVFISWAQCY